METTRPKKLMQLSACNIIDLVDLANMMDLAGTKATEDYNTRMNTDGTTTTYKTGEHMYPEIVEKMKRIQAIMDEP